MKKVMSEELSEESGEWRVESGGSGVVSRAHRGHKCLAHHARVGACAAISEE